MSPLFRVDDYRELARDRMAADVGDFIEGGSPGMMQVQQLDGKVLHRKEEK